MKIAHLAYADGGGGAFKAAYRIHKGLRQLGQESSMLVSKRVGNDPAVDDSGAALGRLLAQTATYLDILPWRLLKVHRGDFSSLSWVGSGPLGKLKTLQPDIIQLHWVCAGFMTVEQIGKLNAPVVWRLADMWPLAGAEHYVGEDTRYKQGYRRDNRPAGEKGVDLNRWTWGRKRKAYAKLDHLTIVTPSQWLANCARESVLLQNHRVEVIPTGQDIEVFRPIPKPVAREILRLPQQGKLIMTASMGLGEKRKGVGLLLQALALLKDHGYQLLLLGDPPRQAPDGPMPVHYLGRLQDDVALALAYSAADVFVAASVEENLANTVIEAMACGIPCVAFNIGGMPDIIRHACNGYLAEPFAVADLAQGILTILQSGDYYASFSGAARLTVEQEFSEPLQARRYLSLYQELLA